MLQNSKSAPGCSGRLLFANSWQFASFFSTQVRDCWFLGIIWDGQMRPQSLNRNMFVIFPLEDSWDRQMWVYSLSTCVFFLLPGDRLGWADAASKFEDERVEGAHRWCAGASGQAGRLERVQYIPRGEDLRRLLQRTGGLPLFLQVSA